MNPNDPFNGKADDEPMKIPVNDKRRVTEDGIREDVKEESSAKTPQKSPRETELEAKLKEKGYTIVPLRLFFNEKKSCEAGNRTGQRKKIAR